MTTDQITIVAILVGALALFVWERWRYDLVATAALIAVVLTGLVAPEQAFAGFGHPATITVAAVLVMTRGFANSGAVDLLARPLGRLTGTAPLHVAGLCGMAALLSAFMNNIAALALMMPVAVQSAKKAGRSPSLVLMPLAFAAVLGGIVTLIGTPPNIILSSFRAETGAGPFALLDFAPVGLPVAVIAVAFLATVGWRLLGAAASRVAEGPLAEARAYQAEIRLPAGSPSIGRSLADLETSLREIDAVFRSVIRGQRRLPANRQWVVLREGDILAVRAAPEELDKLLAVLGAEAVAADAHDDAPAAVTAKQSGTTAGPADDLAVVEAVVHPSAPIIGRTIASLDLQRLHELTPVALSRKGRPPRRRLRETVIEGGDVLLLQGEPKVLEAALPELGCLPIAGTAGALGGRGRAGLGLSLFFGAIGLGGSGLVDLPIALITGAVAMVLTGLIPVRQLYDSIDWPVIVLLGAMMPLGDAFESTGTTGLVAELIVRLSGDLPSFVVIGAVILVSMLLSDLLNNAATALIMGPIAVAIAQALGQPVDAYLMAVAVGASCSFLTPVGHQNYTLVMGPGGYRFVDYARLGLPLELLVLLVATPLIVLIWT